MQSEIVPSLVDLFACPTKRQSNVNLAGGSACLLINQPYCYWKSYSQSYDPSRYKHYIAVIYNCVEISKVPQRCIGVIYI